MHIFTDADNTLWDTNAVFARAQLALLREAEGAIGVRVPDAADAGLAYLRAVDQRIANVHRHGLRYPPALLARGLAVALRDGLDAESVARAVSADESQQEVWVEQAVDAFMARLREMPVLREGVREGLDALVRLSGNTVTVVTEEEATRCADRLAVHELGSFVGEIVSAPKNRRLYADLRRTRARANGAAIMVGDQFDRDIAPARLEGYRAFHFLGDFNPFWSAADSDSLGSDVVGRYTDVAERLSDVSVGRIGSRSRQRRAGA